MHQVAENSEYVHDDDVVEVMKWGNGFGRVEGGTSEVNEQLLMRNGDDEWLRRLDRHQRRLSKARRAAPPPQQTTSEKTKSTRKAQRLVI